MCPANAPPCAQQDDAKAAADKLRAETIGAELAAEEAKQEAAVLFVQRVWRGRRAFKLAKLFAAEQATKQKALWDAKKQERDEARKEMMRKQFMAAKEGAAKKAAHAANVAGKLSTRDGIEDLYDDTKDKLVNGVRLRRNCRIAASAA